MDRACWLGRPHEDDPDDPPLAFVVQRPASVQTVLPFASTAISRRQLRLNPLPADPTRVHVRNAGRRPLYVNDVEVEEATVGAGDTLMLEHTAVFVLELRAPVLPWSVGTAFDFGAADAFGMVGESGAAWELRAELASAAAADAHVLLLGETGAGKEVAARVVHGMSGRREGPLVARNAATMPDTLLDAELFGNARNYPNTGSPEREGLIGAAHGGHLFLDEIGELPEGHQAHLLRVLDTGGEYHRLGETRARVSDVRLIAATNRDPGSLKHDFLARFTRRVRVPGLNQRPGDIPLLIRELVGRAARQNPERVERFLGGGELQRLRLEPALVEALVRHEYRQHTRELERLLEVSISTSRNQEYLTLTPEVREELASKAPTSGSRTVPPDTGGERIADELPTADELSRVLESVGGNVSQAARQLGVSRHAVHRLIKTHRLTRKFGTSD